MPSSLAFGFSVGGGRYKILSKQTLLIIPIRPF